MKEIRVPGAFALMFALCLVGCATGPQVVLRPISNPLPPERPGVVDVSKVQVQPIPTRQSAPRYPLELRKAGLAGEGVVLFTVRTDGTVDDISIIKATDVRFGDAAAAAVALWRFRPAQMNGVPVNCRMLVPVVFTLNQD